MLYSLFNIPIYFLYYSKAIIITLFYVAISISNVIKRNYNYIYKSYIKIFAFKL